VFSVLQLLSAPHADLLAALLSEQADEATGGRTSDALAGALRAHNVSLRSLDSQLLVECSTSIGECGTSSLSVAKALAEFADALERLASQLALASQPLSRSAAAPNNSSAADGAADAFERSLERLVTLHAGRLLDGQSVSLRMRTSSAGEAGVSILALDVAGFSDGGPRTLELSSPRIALRGDGSDASVASVQVPAGVWASLGLEANATGTVQVSCVLLPRNHRAYASLVQSSGVFGANDGIVSISLWRNGVELAVEELAVPLTITLPANGSPREPLSGTQCSYWDVRTGAWSEQGCERVPGAQPDAAVVCACDHLTQFATSYIEAQGTVAGGSTAGSPSKEQPGADRSSSAGELARTTLGNGPGTANTAGVLTLLTIALAALVAGCVAHGADVKLDRQPAMPRWKALEGGSVTRAFASALLRGSSGCWWLMRLPGEQLSSKMRAMSASNTLLLELALIVLLVGGNGSNGRFGDGSNGLMAVAVTAIALGLCIRQLLLRPIFSVACRRTPLARLRDSSARSFAEDSRKDNDEQHEREAVASDRRAADVFRTSRASAAGADATICDLEYDSIAPGGRDSTRTGGAASPGDSTARGSCGPSASPRQSAYDTARASELSTFRSVDRASAITTASRASIFLGGLDRVQPTLADEPPSSAEHRGALGEQRTDSQTDLASFPANALASNDGTARSSSTSARSPEGVLQAGPEGVPAADHGFHRARSITDAWRRPQGTHRPPPPPPGQKAHWRPPPPPDQAVVDAPAAELPAVPLARFDSIAASGLSGSFGTLSSRPKPLLISDEEDVAGADEGSTERGSACESQGRSSFPTFRGIGSKSSSMRSIHPETISPETAVDITFEPSEPSDSRPSTSHENRGSAAPRAAVGSTVGSLLAKLGLQHWLDRRRAHSPEQMESRLLYVCPVNALALAAAGAQSAVASARETGVGANDERGLARSPPPRTARKDELLLPAKALVSIATREGEVLGVFVRAEATLKLRPLKLSAQALEQAEAATFSQLGLAGERSPASSVADRSPSRRSRRESANSTARWSADGTRTRRRSAQRGQRPPPPREETELRRAQTASAYDSLRRGLPTRPDFCPDLRFVRLKLVRSAPSAPAEAIGRDLYRLAGDEAARLAGKEVRMVRVMPEQGAAMPRGVLTSASDVCCELDTARAQLLEAFNVATGSKRSRVAPQLRSPKVPFWPRPPPTANGTGAAAVEIYARIGEAELRHACLWWSEPAGWKVQLAWAAHWAVCLALGVLILVESITNARLNPPGVWGREVIVSLVYGQLLKLLLVEPVFALAVLLVCVGLRTSWPNRASESMHDAEEPGGAARQDRNGAGFGSRVASPRVDGAA
jgi:hypothetical protein